MRLYIKGIKLIKEFSVLESNNERLASYLIGSTHSPRKTFFVQSKSKKEKKRKRSFN
jgi:hypothetical protein